MKAALRVPDVSAVFPGTGTAKIYVQNWLPLVAAAQLTKKRPEESELLQSWLNVVDTD